MTLPTDPNERKKIALSLLFDYFGDALAEVSKVIRAGQVQHNTPGWDRTKSTDHEDCLLRHFMDRGTVDKDGIRHSAKMVWRSLAILQLELEKAYGLPPSRGTCKTAADTEPAPAPVTVEQPEAWRGFYEFCDKVRVQRPAPSFYLMLSDLTEADIGKRFRVVNGPANPIGLLGKTLVLTSCDSQLCEWGFDDSYWLSDPEWRFERVTEPQQLEFKF